MSFGCYAHGLDRTPDLDLPDQRSVPVDVRLLVEEARLSCTTGMLLCLDREQRLAYILGEIFEVADVVGAELLEISRDNFRQRVARARRDLHARLHESWLPFFRTRELVPALRRLLASRSFEQATNSP
jgi:DNA-directed RNA polymerase specialized sigma24 family protein